MASKRNSIKQLYGKVFLVNATSVTRNIVKCKPTVDNVIVYYIVESTRKLKTYNALKLKALPSYVVTRHSHTHM